PDVICHTPSSFFSSVLAAASSAPGARPTQRRDTPNNIARPQCVLIAYLHALNNGPDLGRSRRFLPDSAWSGSRRQRRADWCLSRPAPVSLFPQRPPAPAIPHLALYVAHLWHPNARTRAFFLNGEFLEFESVYGKRGVPWASLAPELNACDSL